MIQKNITFKEYFGFTPEQLKWAIPNQKSQNCLQRVAYIIDWMGQNFGGLLQGQIYVGDQNISLLRGFGTQFLLEGKRPDGVTIDPIKHGDYYYWVFKDVGTSSVEVKAKNGVSIDYLLVGGGGSGYNIVVNNTTGGGGGAGGLIYIQNQVLNNQFYDIEVANQSQLGLSGNNSIFNGRIAHGGGRGGGYTYKGGDGGSGGGGGPHPSYKDGGLSIATYPELGNKGGNSIIRDAGIYYLGGGGGGAKTEGDPGIGNNANSKAADGGQGFTLDEVFGIENNQLTNTLINANVLYANFPGICGGGGGGSRNGERGYGTHGGGHGGENVSSVYKDAEDGKPNTGGGGGGITRVDPAGSYVTQAGNGGSGICIIRIEVTKNIVIQAIQQYYNENIEEVVINNTATMQDVLEVMNRINQKWQQ